jgi:hypothetical protein
MNCWSNTCDVIGNWYNQFLQTLHARCKIMCKIRESHVGGFWIKVCGYWKQSHKLEGQKNVKISGHKKPCTISNV